MSKHADYLHDAREQLLVTAARFMRENDTIDISLSQLSKASGLNSALVKYYFGNKEGLLRELLDREMVDILQGVERLLKSDMDPEAKLRLHISEVVNKFYEVPFIQLLLMRLIGDSSPPEAQRLADHYLKPVYDLYGSLIEEGVAAGQFRKVDPQLFFFTLVGAVDRFFAARLFMRYCFGEDTLTEELRDRYRAHAVDFIMAGLMKK